MRLKDNEKVKHMIHAIDELGRIWEEIMDSINEAAEVDDKVNDIITYDYPFEKSFEEYLTKIQNWAYAIEDLVSDVREYDTIEQNYCPEADLTYIMKCKYLDGEIKEMECVGWYCGEPDEHYEMYIGRNKAVYGDVEEKGDK